MGWTWPRWLVTSRTNTSADAGQIAPGVSKLALDLEVDVSATSFAVFPFQFFAKF